MRSADGTLIRAHWSPKSNEGLEPTLVLAADLGEAVPEVWRPQVEYLSARFITWAYRGTHAGASSAPPSRRYDVAAHLEDLCAVLAGAEVAAEAPFALMGAGVGARVALEAALMMPQRVRGIVLVGGAAGWRYDWLCRASRVGVAVAKRMVDRGKPRQLLLTAVTHGVEKAMQLSDRTLPVDALDAVATNLRELGTQPAIDQAARIDTPALVLCGAEDPRMPAACAQQLARRLERSSVTIVPRTTSRLAAELPDLVNLEVERFLAELDAP